MDLTIPNALKSKAVGKLEYAEFRPEPLRIAKRAGPKTSYLCPSLSLPTSQTQHNPIPSRRSSIIRNSAKLDLSHQDSTAVSSPWPNRHTCLDVRKQRQYETAPTAMEPVGIVTQRFPESALSYPPANPRSRGSDQFSTDGFGDVVSGNGPAPVQTFSDGTHKKLDLLNPFNDSPLVPKAPTPLIGGRRRVVTADELYCKLPAPNRTAMNHILRRKSSFKHRLISRMMSGLTNRTHSSQAISTIQGSRVSCDEFSNNQKISDQTNPARRSISSVGTDTCGSVLDRALAAFPTPPASKNTSPTTAGSFESSHPESEAHRRFSRPTDAAILGAELILTPEHDQLNSEIGDSIHVAVELKAAITTTQEDILCSQRNRLDIAVVIDNSHHTSPATLLASCETTRYLGSILDMKTDRMAILCTSPIDEFSFEPAIISALSHINMHKLKTALDSVTTSTTDEEPNALEHIVQLAQDVLTKVPPPDKDKEPIESTFGHIIVLTANTGGLSADALVHETMQTHIIYSGIVPQGRQRPNECNGWQLGSMSGYEFRAVSSNKDTDPNSLNTRLRALVKHARTGSLLGSLKDLVLDIKAGPGCSIEGVMGRSSYATLRPGEAKTVLVKLGIGEMTAPGYLVSRTSSLSDTPSDPNDLIKQLDKMLGTSATTILEAGLRYKHPSLPANTTCCITAKCRLKRQLSNSGCKRAPQSSCHDACTVLVHQRLAYHLASYHRPREALNSICEQFGDGGCRSACPEYMKFLMQELKYQARIAELLAILDSPQKTTSPRDDFPGSPFEHFGQGLFDSENSRPQDWITDILDDGSRKLEDVRLSVVGSPGKTRKKPARREQVGSDEARKIWGDMRKVSRDHSQTGMVRVASTSTADEMTKRIKELALNNKRSIGAETLRSLSSSSGKGLGKGLVAPWL